MNLTCDKPSAVFVLMDYLGSRLDIPGVAIAILPLPDLIRQRAAA